MNKQNHYAISNLQQLLYNLMHYDRFTLSGSLLINGKLKTGEIRSPFLIRTFYTSVGNDFKMGDGDAA
jgi:hypothetical protein